MSRSPYDVVIVGAGPAGSVLALLLARAGCSVAVVDRAFFPRPKACGDCLSAEATRLLGRLGLLPAVEALRPARLDGWRIFGPGGACFSAAFSDLGDPDPAVHTALALPRRELDAALLTAAEAAGAAVLTGHLATDLIRDGEWVRGVALRGPDGARLAFGARLVVGADGLRSRVARRLGALRRPPRVRKLSLTTHVCGLDARALALARGGAAAPRQDLWPVPGGDGTGPGRDCTGPGYYGEMHAGDGVCAGLAPVGASGGCWNVTVVADSGRFGREAREPRAFFGQVLGRLPALAALRIEPAELLVSGPFDWPVRRTVFPGAVLVGDAAGYFDPFTGQGIYQALAGAELLAAVVAPLLRSGGSEPIGVRELQPYASGHRTLTRGVRRVQQLVHHVLDRPRLAERAIAGLARRPGAVAALLAVTSDLRPAGSLLSPTLGLSLLRPLPAARSVTPHRLPTQ